MPITAAIRNTSSRAKTRRRSGKKSRDDSRLCSLDRLRHGAVRSSSYLRFLGQRHCLLPLRLRILDHRRSQADTHQFVAADHRVAHRPNQNLFAAHEKRGALTVPSNRGEPIILERYRRQRRRTLRHHRVRVKDVRGAGQRLVRLDDRLRPFRLRWRRRAGLKKVAPTAGRRHALQLGQQVEPDPGIHRVGIDLLLRILGMQHRVELFVPVALRRPGRPRCHARRWLGCRRGNPGMRRPGIRAMLLRSAGCRRTPARWRPALRRQHIGVKEIRRHQPERCQRGYLSLIFQAGLHGASSSAPRTNVWILNWTAMSPEFPCGAAVCRLSIIRNRGDLSIRSTSRVRFWYDPSNATWIFTICSVSLPSIASYSFAICPGLTPASAAMRNNSSFNAEEALRRSTTYRARNWSPSRRAPSTFSTSFRVMTTCACAAAS